MLFIYVTLLHAVISVGTYPLHFHMCHDTDGVEYPDPPYLRKNSIYYSFARCITIHGSHGVTVSGNNMKKL